MLTVIASLKGGSGKSTVTFNIAVWLSMAGRQVVAYDLDPQATLSDVAELRREEGVLPAIEIRHGFRGLERAAVDTDVEVLVDVGVADMDAMKKVLSLSDRILVPVTPSQADIWSTQRFLGIIERTANGRVRPTVQAFINRGDTHHAVRESDEAAAALIALPKLEFLRPRLHQRTVYRRSFSEGLAVFELEPRGKGAREFISLAARLFPDVIR